MEQSGADGVRGAQADDAIGHGAGRIARLLGAGQLRQHRDAACALDQVVVGRLGGIGAVLPVAVHADIEDARVHGSDGVVVQAQARHGLRPHVVDQHVGARGQAQHRLPACRLLQVEHQASLAAVRVQEDAGHAFVSRRSDAAHTVAAWRLNLDDVGPQIAQDLRGVGPHQHRRDVDDAHALQRPAHDRTLRLRIEMCKPTNAP
ncbi:hypothetical protein D3C87_1198820 [compost metagenome]